MDVFDLRNNVVRDYAEYVQSFVTIRDERIWKAVEAEFASGLLWPEPLIQLNPAFQQGPPLQELVDDGTLHPECLRIFRKKDRRDSDEGPLRLHQHQVEGILAANRGENYVLTEWRLAEYLRRGGPDRGADRFVCRVSHADGRPMLFLPDRERTPGIPEGWREVRIEGEPYQARFVKVAVNVVTAPGSVENVLPDVLRSWFGAEAGQPGRTDAVLFERRGDGYVLRPVEEGFQEPNRPVPWQRYTRRAGLEALGLTPQGRELQSGVVNRREQIVLFVTLDKESLAREYQYRDRFLSPTELQWQSQNRTSQTSEMGRKIREHRERGIEVHLFARRRAKVGGQTQPFLYCGTLDLQRWEGERPITAWWRLEEAVPEEMWGEMGVGGEA